VPAGKEATCLLDTDTLFKSVRNKLLESGKEPVVVMALWISPSTCIAPTTAKALGLTVPESFLVRADGVIE
jgi:hypothetical protein